MNLTETLSSALLNLTKQDAIHYETVANQIRETRTALLLASGTDISKMEDVATKLAQLEKINDELGKKQKQLAEIHVQASTQRAVLSHLNEDVSSARNAKKPAKAVIGQ